MLPSKGPKDSFRDHKDCYVIFSCNYLFNLASAQLLSWLSVLLKVLGRCNSTDVGLNPSHGSCEANADISALFGNSPSINKALSLFGQARLGPPRTTGPRGPH